MIDQSVIEEILRTHSDGRLFHREGQELEFKQQFNFAGLAEYLRDFAAFANNRGGCLVFGVQDSPRIPVGLTPKSLEQFEKIDPETITGFLTEIFAPSIDWDQAMFKVGGKAFGVMCVGQAKEKPVIAKKDDGKAQEIRNGDIYYRYAGRTQRILSSELESIISHRVSEVNRHWIDLVQKIGSAGPQNAAILDTERAVIAKQDSQILVLDDKLAKGLRFIKEGDFSEKKGAKTLKLVGDVQPVETLEVVKHVKENLIKEYPYSAVELVAEVKTIVPDATQHAVWMVIKENGMKEDPDYAALNFRSKSHEDRFRNTGKLPNGTPSIYNRKAVEFIAKVLSD